MKAVEDREPDVMDGAVGGEMAFVDHLEELRKRIIASLLALAVATAVAYVVYPHIFAFLVRPLQAINGATNNGKLLFVNSLFEGFVTRLKISVLVGLIVSFPFHIFNILQFVLPGLRDQEKRVVILSILVSFILVLGGGYYGYGKMIPMAVRFFTSSGFIPSKVGLLLNYNKSILYVLQFLMVSLAIFELPVVLEICMVVGILKRRYLIRISRYVVVAIFILAAVITPPDPVSQLIVAVPLIGLYFLSILVARVFGFGE